MHGPAEDARMAREEREASEGKNRVQTTGEFTLKILSKTKKGLSSHAYRRKDRTESAWALCSMSLQRRRGRGGKCERKRRKISSNAFPTTNANIPRRLQETQGQGALVKHIRCTHASCISFLTVAPVTMRQERHYDYDRD